MESKEDRLKKLEAGKEKLAAFRKRKATKKKRDIQKNVDATDLDAGDMQNHENGIGFDPPSLTDMKDVWSDSDQLSCTSEDEWSTEEMPSKSTVFLEAKLAQAKHRIAELEEAMEGKQLALDAAIKNSETSKLQGTFNAEASNIESSSVDENPELTEFESALAQRDALLSQLSATLFESLGNTELNATVQAQVDALAEHVYQLQTQLHQADKTLEEQLALHNSSAKAVHDAKFQMLQLQEIITNKDQELALLTQQRNQAMLPEPSQNIGDGGSQPEIEDQIVAEVASNLSYAPEPPASKEQVWALREEEWVAREKEWMSQEQRWALRDEERASREQLLQASIESQAAQIRNLSTSLEAMKAEEQKLQATCAQLEAQLEDAHTMAADKLSRLELELQELREAHESDQNQIQSLSQVRQELEEKVDSQNASLSQKEALQEEYDALSSKYTECLSLLRDSELAKCDLEQKLQLVNLSTSAVNSNTELDRVKLNHQDESEKQIESLKNYVELENKYSVDIDALNNKINELQSVVQKSEAALQDARNATEAERGSVAELQKALQEKNEQLGEQDLKLLQLEEACKSLKSENRKIQQVLDSKEKIATSQAVEYKTAQDALQQLEKERCSYADQIAALQGELIAAEHVHGVEQSELQYHRDKMEEHMENMQTEIESLQAKLKEVEFKLTAEQDSKVELLEKIHKLENELETATGEEYSLLQSIQSLSNKLEPLQEQLQTSESGSETSETELSTEAKRNLSKISRKECDMLVSKIDSLTRGMDQCKSQLENSEAMVNDLTEKLKHSEETLSSTKMELNNVQQINMNSAKQTEIQLEKLQARASEAEQLQIRVAALEDMEQQLLERDKCQEELQKQLEDTVSHWQKLQRIVQEKEVDLQRSEEMLEEQQRICATLRKTFNEEREEFESEINGLKDTMQHEKDERTRVDCEVWDLRGKVQILEGEIEVLTDTKCSNMAVLSGTVAKLQTELTQAKARSEIREAEILAVQQGIEERVENLTIDITEKDTEIGSLKRDAQVKEKEISGLETELSGLRDENMEQKATVAQLENAVTTLKAQLEGKDLEIKDLTSSDQSEKEKMQVLEIELDGLRKAFAEISSSVNQNISGPEDLLAEFKKKEEDFVQLQSVVRQLEADLENERCSNKQAVEAVETEFEKTREELESTLAERSTLQKELAVMKLQSSDVGNSHEQLQAAHSEVLLKLDDRDQSLQSIAREKESIGAELAQIKEHLCQVKADHNLLLGTHSDLQAKHKEMETALQGAEKRKCELEAELAQVRDELSDTENNQAALQTACSEIQAKLDESQNTLLGAMKDKEQIESDLNQFKQTCFELERNHTNLNVSHSELKDKLENKEKMFDAEIKEKENLVEEVTNLKSQLSDVVENNKIYQTSCSEMQEKLMLVETKLQEAGTEKENQEKKLYDVNQELSEMHAKCQLLQDSLSQIQTAEGEKNEAGEKLRQELAEKEGIVSQLREEKELLSSHIVEMTTSYDQLQSSETSLKDAYDTLKTENEKRSTEMGVLQDKLSNSEQTVGRLEGIVSSVSNELQERDEALIEQASQIAKLKEEVQQKSVEMEELSEKLKRLQQQNDLFASEADSSLKENIEKQEYLKTQLDEIKRMSSEKKEQLLMSENLLDREKRAHEETLKKLRKLELESCRVQSELSHCIECAHEREAYMVDQATLIDQKNGKLGDALNELSGKDAELIEIQNKLKSLSEEHAAALSQIESLQSAKETLQADILGLQVNLDNQETTNTQYAVECKQLNERLTQMSQTLEGKDAVVFNLNHDIEMYQKEIDDLRSEVVQRDTTIAGLQEDLSSAKLTVDRKHEEAEMLKSNFDSCMEDMQVKLTEQEAKTKRLQSQLAEEARNVHQGKDELKEVYEQQINQMEDKIIKCEQQNEQLEKDLQDVRSRAASSKDLHEHQLAELELNLQASNSDLIRCKNELSKVTSNHECAVAGLKRLHEIQSSELEDNCMALEKTIAEQKRKINEMQNKFHKDKINSEQNFEIQLSDVEEKRRMTEHEVDRVKRHLEEMKSDHAREMQHLEKSYEARLFELEDKVCVAVSERDRLRASLADQSDSNSVALESKLQEVEVVRRELELRNHALDDEVLSLKESAQQREEEMMTVLKNAAERHKEDTDNLNMELNRVNEKILEQSKQLATVKADYEEKIQDLEMNNCQLKEKVKILEMHAEHDQELREGEQFVDLRAENTELQSKVVCLSEEINSLKLQLFKQRQSERNEVLVRGVEEICPPFQSTSDFIEDDCFSPTDEQPVKDHFVAEHSKQYAASPRGIDAVNKEEPDFVEGFQPEIEDEQILGKIQPLHSHPIQETAVNEGFQPDSDMFVMEETDDGMEQDRWLPNVSVGMSPSHLNANKLQFDFPEPTGNTCHGNNSFDGFTSEAKEFTSAELEKKIQAVRDELEEQYVGKMRKQEVELAHDFATKQEIVQREMEQNYVQRVQAIKYEWEQKFTKALQKMRREMEKKHMRDLNAVWQGTSSPRSTGTSPRETRTELNSRDQEDLGETVEQLHRENQELAEVRDVLLQQIEMSQARGLHTKVQHELQSLLSNRDVAPPASQTSQTSTARTTPTRTAASPSPEDEGAGEGKDTDTGDIDADVASEVSDTSSARERFMEELEDIAQQSSQDLPLEWELTTTLMASAMIGAGDAEVDGGTSTGGSGPPEHRSIWEVFDGRCVRQDCQEVRLKLHRITEWLLEVRARGDEAVPVSDLTLFLDEGFLFGDKDDGFFFLPDSDSNVDFVVEEGSSEVASDKSKSPRSVAKETLTADVNPITFLKNRKQITLGNSDDSETTVQSNPSHDEKNNLFKQSDLNEEKEENFDINIKLLTELELLRKEKFDLENKCEILQTQNAEQHAEKTNFQEELNNIKRVLETPKTSPVKCDINTGQNATDIEISVDSGLDLSRSKNHGHTHYSNVSIQTEAQEDFTAQSVSASNDRIIHHLQLLLVEKESALSVLEQDVRRLKDEAKMQQTNSVDVECDNATVKTIEEQMQTLRDALAAKDKVIEALQEDSSYIPPTKSDTPEVSDVQEISQNFGPGDSEEKEKSINADPSSSVSMHGADDSTELYITALQDYSTSLSVDVKQGAGPSVSATSSSNSLQMSFPGDNLSSERSEQDTPTGLQDKELEEELNKLRKDMKETKALYCRENILLQEALYRDRKAKYNMMNKKDTSLALRRTASDNSNFPPLDLGSFELNTSIPNTSAEVETMKQRLEICLEQNRMLERENSTLRGKLREQEATVVQLKVKLEQNEHDTQHWRDSFSSQIRALQSQRNDLMQLIRDLDSGKQSSALCQNIPDGESGGGTRGTETSVKFQEDLMERLEELDHLHRMLTQRQVELQHCESERRHLEQLCLLKDLTEMQLMRQKRLMEEQLSELELRLRERESVIVEEKAKLLAELRSKDACLSGLDGASGCANQEAHQFNAPSSCLNDSHFSPGYSPLESTPLRNASTPRTCLTPPASPEEADRQHLEAIERLRSKLKLEYEIRTARMAESEAAAMASYWERQQSKQT